MRIRSIMLIATLILTISCVTTDRLSAHYAAIASFRGIDFTADCFTNSCRLPGADAQPILGHRVDLPESEGAWTDLSEWLGWAADRWPNQLELDRIARNSLEELDALTPRAFPRWDLWIRDFGRFLVPERPSKLVPHRTYRLAVRQPEFGYPPRPTVVSKHLHLPHAHDSWFDVAAGNFTLRTSWLKSSVASRVRGLPPCPRSPVTPLRLPDAERQRKFWSDVLEQYQDWQCRFTGELASLQCVSKLTQSVTARLGSMAGKVGDSLLLASQSWPRDASLPAAHSQTFPQPNFVVCEVLDGRPVLITIRQATQWGLFHPDGSSSAAVTGVISLGPPSMQQPAKLVARPNESVAHGAWLSSFTAANRLVEVAAACKRQLSDGLNGLSQTWAELASFSQSQAMETALRRLSEWEWPNKDHHLATTSDADIR